MTCQASMEVNKESNDLIWEKVGLEAMKEKGKIYVHEEGMRLGTPRRCSAPICAWHTLTPYSTYISLNPHESFINLDLFDVLTLILEPIVYVIKQCDT